MSIAESKITAQGQISIPAKVRKKLGVAPGSVLEWYEQDGKIFVRRASKHTSKDIHDAIFKVTPSTKSPSDMDKGVRDQMRQKHERRWHNVLVRLLARDDARQVERAEEFIAVIKR